VRGPSYLGPSWQARRVDRPNQMGRPARPDAPGGSACPARCAGRFTTTTPARAGGRHYPARPDAPAVPSRRRPPQRAEGANLPPPFPPRSVRSTPHSMLPANRIGILVGPDTTSSPIHASPSRGVGIRWHLVPPIRNDAVLDSSSGDLCAVEAGHRRGRARYRAGAGRSGAGAAGKGQTGHRRGRARYRAGAGRSGAGVAGKGQAGHRRRTPNHGTRGPATSRPGSEGSGGGRPQRLPHPRPHPLSPAGEWAAPRPTLPRGAYRTPARTPSGPRFRQGGVGNARSRGQTSFRVSPSWIRPFFIT
jgi:hypothetical protein